MVWYRPTSTLYQNVLSLTAKSFFYGNGEPPNSTPDFKRAWMSFVRDQGIRIYRKEDWNAFWHRVYMDVIMYQVSNIGNDELTPYSGLFDSKIKRLLSDMPDDKPVLSRGQYFGSYVPHDDLVNMRTHLQGLLVYTAEASEKAGQDYPGWFTETDNIVKALFNGMSLRPEKEKKYFFTRNGVGAVGDIDVKPYGNYGVDIQDHQYSLEDAKKLAYTILESVRYVEEQAYVAEENEKKSVKK